MKILTLIISFVLMVNPVLAQQIVNNDTLILGNKSSSSDKKIQLRKSGGTTDITVENSTGTIRLGAEKVRIGTGDHGIRVNNGNLEFSNDDSLWKKIGSGSGTGDGGVSILENGSFEDGLTPGWVNSGGTFTQETYTNGAEGETKYARFVASGSGEYFETVADAIPDFSTGGCLAKINYNTTDDANWKLQVYSGSDLLKETTLYAKNWIDGHASFPCPVAGTNVKLRVISLAAGQIEADKGYLGKENRTFQMSQAKVLVRASLSTTQAMTENVFAKITYDAESQDSNNEFSSSRFTPKLAGDYEFSGSVDVSTNAGTYEIVVVLYKNGVPTLYRAQAKSGTASTSSSATYVFNIPLVVGDYVEIWASTSIDATIRGNNSASGLTNLDIKYFPTGTQTALVPEAQDWFIDASIGGANASLGTASVSSYTEITNASLDMVLNTGSASAKIPCSSTNASTGLTCSVGNEGIGVVFTPPTPGFYEVCGQFNHYVAASAGGNGGAAFQFVETSPSTQTIIQEGKAKSVSRSNPASTALEQSFPHRNCGVFYFSSVNEKTIRLMYEQSVGGTVNSSSVMADRSASVGQQDVNIVVRPLLSAYNRPYLTGDQVTTPGTVRPVTFSAKITGAGVVSNKKGTNITTATCSAGTWTVNLTGLTTPPNCQVGYVGTANFMFAPVGIVSTSSVLNFYTPNNSTTYICDNEVVVNCHGD